MSRNTGFALAFWIFVHFLPVICKKKTWNDIVLILVPRGRAPFGQHQESRPLARSNNGSPLFANFSSLCACSESSLKKSDWLWSQSIVFTNPFKTGMSLNLARGRDSWCWPKGAQPLGTRMPSSAQVLRILENVNCSGKVFVSSFRIERCQCMFSLSTFLGTQSRNSKG